VNNESVTAVICVYTLDRWPHILRAIESIKAQSTQPLELIVVVDHNRELFERLNSSVAEVRIMESAGPKGKSGALNTAITEAVGSIIALLDDDACADRDWLANLIADYDDPNVLGVGGHLEPEWQDGRPAWFPEEFLWAVGCTFRGMPSKRSRVRALIGANMSFRRDVFLEVGGSRPGLGPDGTALVGAARAEDTEFCLRASARWPDRYWIYEPSSRVRHFVPSARTTWSFFIARCRAEGASKAVLARTVGAQKGLAMERRYSTRTLPSGVVLETLRAIRYLEPSRIGRAGAIVAGFAVTTIAYVRESASGAAFPHN
jgi:GT2 family glycosyltransferase